MEKDKLYSKEYYVGGKISNYLMYSHAFQHPYYNALMKFILNRCINHGRLLEIGCAFGFFAMHAEKKFETYGIDISEYAIEQAKKYTHKTKLYVADIEKIKLTEYFNQKFNVIVALDVFEHFQYPETVIRDCHGILDTGGYLLLKVPNMNSISLKLFALLGQSKKWIGYKDVTHVSLLTINQWTSILNKYGFEVKIVPHIPTKQLKTYFLRYFPNVFFLPKSFNYFNDSVLLVCKKKLEM